MLGTMPCSIMLFTKSTKQSRRVEAWLPSSSPVRSLRSCGRRPSWPPPDPEQNDLMAIFMSSQVTTKQSSPSGGGGRIDPWCGLGCFSFNLAMVSALAGNTLSFDDVTLTAPRMSATDNFIAKCLAIVGNFGKS